MADFLGELRASMERVLAHGPLTLTVRPWEVECSGRVVYSERDREKSLASRLYHDGVRSLTVHPAVTWEEITRLVGILAVRYAEVRQQEEDVVTMLWKASFEHLTVAAVASYVPTDDHEPANAVAASSSELLRQGVDDGGWQFDSPAPELPRAVELSYAAVPEAELERLRAEEDPSALPASCLRLLRPLLAAAAHPEDPVELELVTPLVREIRDFLLGEGDDAALLEAVRMVHQGARTLPDCPERTALLGTFTEREAFGRMLDAAVATGSVPEALLELVAVAPVDELEVLLGVLASRWKGAGRELGLAIVTDGIGSRLRLLADQILGLTPTVLGDILDVVVARDPELAAPLAVALLRRRDRGARLQALAVLERLPYRSEVGRALTEEALADDDVEVCGGAAEVLAANGERRAAGAVRRALERCLAVDRPAGDPTPLAKALARLDPAAALALFESWTGGQRLRGRAADAFRWRLALSGLALIPGKDAARQLEWIHAHSEGDLRARCIQAMAAQREAERGR